LAGPTAVDSRGSSARRWEGARPRGSAEDDQSDAKPLTEYDEGAGSDANTVYDLYSVYRSVHDKDIFDDATSGVYTPDKNAILQQRCNLHNIAKNLQRLFQVLRVVDRKDVILALGNTGCGKSTLLNSLLFGPDSLELRTISEKMASGREAKKVVIEQKQTSEGFAIGHSQSESKTFLPQFKKVDEDLYYVDIAGLHDSGGDLIQFINCFVNKSIFLRASQVKFLFPITYNQIKENRGANVRE
jgi:hypothetical protein